MKLTKENILFIDTYLKNSEVIYADIRQEMVDHIATAVEEKMEKDNVIFYDAFKDFMAVNKADILKNNKTIGAISWKVVGQFLLFLAKPVQLFFGVLLFLFFKAVDVNHYFSKAISIKNLFFVLIISLAVFQILYFYVYLKKRFYAVEKTGALFLIIYYLQLFFLPIYGRENVSVYTLTSFSFLLFGYIAFFTQTIIKFNQHRFNYL